MTRIAHIMTSAPATILTTATAGATINYTTNGLDPAPTDPSVVSGGSVTVDRVIEEGRQTVSAKLPAVLSVVQSIGEPRYPSFMGIRKASKATIPVWSLGDLSTSAPAPLVKRTELMNPPVRETSVEIINGESLAEIADKLADKILAEKVL